MSPPDPLGPIRGLWIGLAIGLVIWIAVGLVVWLAAQ